MILAQREIVIKQKSAGSVSPANTNDLQLLKEIKNELVEIKNLLAKK